MYPSLYNIIYLALICHITTATKDQLKKAGTFYAPARQQSGQGQSNVPTAGQSSVPIVVHEIPDVESQEPSSSTQVGSLDYLPTQYNPGPSGYVPGQPLPGYQMPGFHVPPQQSGLSLSRATQLIGYRQPRATQLIGYRQPTHTITSAMQEGSQQPYQASLASQTYQQPFASQTYQQPFASQTYQQPFASQAQYQPTLVSVKTEPGTYYEPQTGFQPPVDPFGFQVKSEHYYGDVKEEDIKSEYSESEWDIKEEMKSEAEEPKIEEATPISAIDFRAFGIDINKPIQAFVVNDRDHPTPQGYKRLLVQDTLRRHSYIGRLKTITVKLSELLDPLTLKPIIGKLATLYDAGQLQPVAPGAYDSADPCPVPGGVSFADLAFPESRNAPVIEIEDDPREDTPPMEHVETQRDLSASDSGTKRGKRGKGQGTSTRGGKRTKKAAEVEAGAEQPNVPKRSRGAGSRGGRAPTRGRGSGYPQDPNQ